MGGSRNLYDELYWWILLAGLLAVLSLLLGYISFELAVVGLAGLGASLYGLRCVAHP